MRGITAVGEIQYQSQYQSSPESLSINSNPNLNKGKYEKARKSDVIADLLAKKFNNEEYKGFYWRVASKLPESTIWNFVEQANKYGKNPERYFSYLCKKAGV